MAATALSFLLLTVSLACAEVFVELDSLEVVRGRAEFITNRHLRIKVEPDSDCKVEVVLNEPITQRVGKVTPQVFDCSFVEDEVQYVHSGSPLLKEDSIMLRVYRFSSSQTQVRTVVVSVLILDPVSPLVSLGPNPLLVPDFHGLSNPIDHSVLKIQTSQDLLCTIRLKTRQVQVPAVGQLVYEEDQTNGKGLCSGNKPCVSKSRPVQSLKTGCEDFLKSGLKYLHLSSPSPQTDYIPLTLDLRDRTSRTIVESESVWIPVQIRGAVPDQPPRAAFMASSILEVDQFVLTPVTTATLDAEDEETPRDELVFNVTVPPAGGYITHLDDQTREVRSFTWTDLNDLKIAYQPPHSGQSQRSNDQVQFQAIDGSFQSSAPIVVHISVRSSQTNAPRVSWNMGLHLLEGQSRPITWEQLQIVDRDNINAVYLVAVDGPLHGQLTVRGVKAFMLRLADLHSGAVVYSHDDSDTSHDHIVFRISDGRHSVRHRFPISVLPKDDSAPFLLNNVALQVPEGGRVWLRDHLLASDLDSSDQHILFTICSKPRTGTVVRKTNPNKRGLVVDSFLQKELVQGQIYYQHSGDETHEDTFDFRLSDSHELPNLSQVYTVVVHVFPVKDQLPVEVPGPVRSLTVREDQVVYLTQDQLHFRDREQPQNDLTYTITKSCYSPKKPGLMDAGRLFFTDTNNSMKRDQMVPVLKSFTQSAVNHMKVGFMPPVEDIGPDPVYVQFEFSVSDLQGGTVSGLVFNITILPVDDQAPQAFTNLLRVEEGGAAFVTEEHLLVRDRDSPEEKLTVRILKRALHGRMALQGGTLEQGQNFTLMDVRALRVRYIHDDSETTADEVGLKVTDGINSVNVVLSVQILPVNDEPPELGRPLLVSMVCDESSKVRINADYLWATDRDSEDQRLVYMLARTPALGELQKSGLTVDRFSQHDLVQGLVYYVHTGGEIGPDPVLDSVTLIISDGEAGGTDGCCHEDALPPPVPLHGTLPVYDLNVTVLPVNNKAPSVTLGESLLNVDEGSSVCLCGGLLGATDLDSPSELLTFHLQTPPLHGFIENILPPAGSEKSSAGIPVESFTLTDLTSGFINYVQSEHKGVEPTVDELTLFVSDGLHDSAPVAFYIIINPTNDEIPTLQLNNFTVQEGGLRELTPLLLDAFDLDAPLDTLIFSVLCPPQHGRLVSALHSTEALSIDEFTLQELRQGLKLVYVHDDSETLQDSLELSLSDGVHSVRGSAFVTVQPVDDQTPILIRNAGLEVDSGQRRVISSVSLEAEDLDSLPDQVYYILNTAPRHGQLQRKSDPDWSVLSPGQNFSQSDVEMNRLWYVHTPPAVAVGTGDAAIAKETGAGVKGPDSFRFTLSDLHNESPVQTFYISIRTSHKGELHLLTRPVRLVEGQRFILNTDVLLAWDSSGLPQELVYTVTVPPWHGLVSLVNRPGVAMVTFTQLDVSAQRLCYTHDNSHEHESDSFSFVVSNGVSSRGGTLFFHIELTDRIPPTLSVNSGLRLREGSAELVLSRDHLLLTDPDTAVGNLTYEVLRLPLYGTLLLRGLPLTRTERRFSQTDVDQGRVSYSHDTKSPTLIDTFYFLPSDGTNKGFIEFRQLRTEPAIFKIQVERLDRSVPSLVSRLSPSSVTDLGSGRFGLVLDSSHLQGSDPDCVDEELTFTISREPRFGHLENTLTGSYIKGRFTQRDINHRAVVYVIPVDVEVTHDNFLFILSDPTGNSLPPQSLDLSWSRVELSASCYRTCETSGTLQIQVQRSGTSSDPAFVAVQVEEGTAKVGRDFTHSSAALIQFDPGVKMKTWSVFPIDDRLEENHESFTVFLKNPRNAVLGPRTTARVEILDPREGQCDLDSVLDTDHPLVPLVPAKPEPGPEEDLDPVTDIETELIFENDSWTPPRGDVPDRDPYQDYTQRDQAWYQTQGLRKTQYQSVQHHQNQDRGLKVHVSTERRPEERVWTFHSLTPLRVEHIQTPQRHLVQEFQLRDAPHSHHSHHRLTTDQLKTQPREVQSAGGVSGLCPSGWTHHRGCCFLLSSSVASWSSADRTCSLLFNSSLPRVESRRVLPWLWRFSRKRPFWIGVSGAADSDVLTLLRLKGALSDHNDPSSHCVLVQNLKNWVRTDCSSETEHAFICSRPGLSQD